MARSYKPKHFKDFSQVLLEKEKLNGHAEPTIEKTWQQLRDESVTEKVTIKPKTENHYKFINSILTNVITVVTGCAGTGKTWISCGVAAKLLLEGKIDKITLTHPQIEVGGSKVGFLPGNPAEKIMPYMIPLIDALGVFLGEKTVDKLIKDEIINIQPVGLMRGHSIKNACIIADESQNLSYVELKMLLSRLDTGSRLILTADTGQSDLITGSRDFELIISKIYDLKDEIGFIKFEPCDIMRSGIVRKILERI